MCTEYGETLAFQGSHGDAKSKTMCTTGQFRSVHMHPGACSILKNHPPSQPVHSPSSSLSEATADREIWRLTAFLPLTRYVVHLTGKCPLIRLCTPYPGIRHDAHENQDIEKAPRPLVTLSFSISDIRTSSQSRRHRPYRYAPSYIGASSSDPSCP